MAELTDKELGVAVAKEVMGWVQWDGIFDYNGPFPMFCDWGGDGLDVYEDEESGGVTRYWAPWRLIADAWGVLEKLRADGHDVFMEYRADQRAWVDFELAGQFGDNDWCAEADTMQLAILSAALKVARCELSSVNGKDPQKREENHELADDSEVADEFP